VPSSQEEKMVECQFDDLFAEIPSGRSAMSLVIDARPSRA